MTRYDDSVSCERLRSFRSTSGRVLRSRFIALGLALGFATFWWTSSAFSAEYGSGLRSTSSAGSPMSASAAASRSQYLQAQRQQAALAQQNQAAAEARYQQELLARQQNQAAMAQYQAQQRQAQQAQAAIPAAPQTDTGSSKKLLSGLWNKSDSSKSGGSQEPRQSFLTSPFQGNRSDAAQQPQYAQQRQQEPERNNILGFSKLLGRSSQPSSREQAASQYSQAPTRQAYAGSQSAASQAPFAGTHAYAGSQAQYAHSPYARPQGSAAPSAEALAQASTDRNDARDALARVPWNALSPKAQTKLQQLASSSTLYRRLPMAGGRCNPELFDYFLSHPNAVVELWRSMGYEDVTMIDQGNDVYEVREKSGSVGKLQILYQDAELSIAYCSGSYRGPAFGRQMNGEVFLILQTRYTEDVDRTPFVVCRLDAFIDLKNPGFDFLARTFSSTVGRIADTNFEQTLAFVDSVSQTIEANPRDFAGVAMSLQGLSPDARRMLAVKAERVGAQAQARRRGEIVEYQLLAKKNQPTATYARILSRGNTASRALAQTPSVMPQESESANSYSAPQTTTSFRPSTTPGLSTSRNSSLGKTAEFEQSFASNEFALAEEDEDSYLSEWSDDEAELVYDSSDSVVSGGSLAKVGARPSTNAKALNLLDEQENRSAPGYAAAAPTTLATDDLDEDASADVAMPLVNEDFELADESGDELVESDDSLIAIPLELDSAAPLATEGVEEAAELVAEESVDDSDATVALPLEAEEEIALNDDEAPILLMLPEDDSFAAEESDEAASDEPAVESETVDVSENSNAPLLVFSALDDEGVEEETPSVVALDVDSLDESAVDEEEIGAEEDAQEVASLDESAEEEEEIETAAPAPVKSKKKESADLNAEAGWTPVAQSAAKPIAKPVAKVAMRVDSQSDASNWRGGSVKNAVPSVPSKFVTRRYSAPTEADDSGAAPFIATFESDSDDGGATFKKPVERLMK